MNVDLARARAQWKHRGGTRPPWAIVPEAGQESVWDYPRPPRLEPDARLVRVVHQGTTIAETRAAIRVLETASPPTFYIPPDDIDFTALVRSTGGSHCEWKGAAAYWALRSNRTFSAQVGWSYDAPYPEFRAIAGYLSFYPAKVDCFVGSERALPQPGGFYGGWVTPEIVGPFKGEPGTAGW